MTDNANNENAVHQQDEVQQEVYSKADVDALVSGLKKQVNSLLDEKKDAKRAAEAAKEDALQKAGDLDEYKKHYEGKLSALQSDYEDKYSALNNAMAQRDQAEVIAKLSGEFVDSEAGAFMLKSMIEVQDGNQKFKDFAGNMVADNIDDFKQWMATNPHMSHLVRGTKATGGGASGGASGAGGDKVMSRSQFDSMNPIQQSNFITKENGKVIND